MNIKDIIRDLEGADTLDSLQFQTTEFVDSGSYALNKIISGKFKGGYPIGSITEIWGEAAAGKTVFLTHAFIGAQKKGYYTVMVDNEHSYSPPFAQSLGLDISKLIYAEPVTIEDCFDFIEKTILKIRENDSATPIVIGFDSLGTPPCRKEMESEIGENDTIIGALRAKVMGNCLKRINPLLKRHKVALIVINQIRSKIGVMFGDPRTKAGGGKSLEYYCSVSLETRIPKSGTIKNEFDKVVGVQGTITTTKNKVATPYQECDFELFFNKGLTRNSGLCGLLIREGLVKSPSKGFYAFVDVTDGSKSREDSINTHASQRIDTDALI